MARDQRKKRYAEQIEQDASTDYMPIISGGTINNILLLNADGEAADSGIAIASSTFKLSQLVIEDGTNADTLKCTLSSLYNGDAIGATDNIAKGATTGNYTLSADGLTLTIEAAGLAGNITLATGAKVYNEGGPILDADISFGSNDIIILMRNPTSGVGQDIPAHIDTSATVVIKLNILYLVA